MMYSRSLLLCAFLLNGCFWNKDEDDQPALQTPKTLIEIPSGGSKAPVVASVGGAVTASINPNSAAPQLIEADAASNIADVLLAFPAGAFTVPANVTMKEGSALEASVLIGELGVTATALTASSPPVQIGASAAVDLQKPMIVALPVPSSLALSGGTYGVAYRIQIQATGQRLSGFIPSTELTLDGNKLLYPTKYFGWFQVVAFDTVVAAVEREATLPTFLGIEVVFSATIPSCGKADLGRTIYVKEEAAFKYCGANGYEVIDLKGATGATGAAGPAGPEGSSGSSLYLYDALSRKIGTFGGFKTYTANAIFNPVITEFAFMTVGTASSSNLGYLAIDLASGLSHPVCLSGNCDLYFTSYDCSGTPVLDGVPMKNTVVRSGSGFVKIAGGEFVTQFGPFNSSLAAGQSCFATTYAPIVGRQVTSPYTFPAGMDSPPYIAPVIIAE